jgi:hypothetical protein
MSRHPDLDRASTGENRAGGPRPPAGASVPDEARPATLAGRVKRAARPVAGPVIEALSERIEARIQPEPYWTLRNDLEELAAQVRAHEDEIVALRAEIVALRLQFDIPPA